MAQIGSVGALLMPHFEGHKIAELGGRGEKKLSFTLWDNDCFASTQHSPNMPSTYKKEKPWDTDDIDKWEVSDFAFFRVCVWLTCDRSNPSRPMITPAVPSQRSPLS